MTAEEILKLNYDKVEGANTEDWESVKKNSGGMHEAILNAMQEYAEHYHAQQSKPFPTDEEIDKMFPIRDEDTHHFSNIPHSKIGRDNYFKRLGATWLRDNYPTKPLEQSGEVESRSVNDYTKEKKLLVECLSQYNDENENVSDTLFTIYPTEMNAIVRLLKKCSSSTLSNKSPEPKQSPTEKAIAKEAEGSKCAKCNYEMHCANCENDSFPM